MNKINAATILMVSGLVGYIVLRFGLPALQVERLIFIAVFAIVALGIMFLYRREKNKPTA